MQLAQCHDMIDLVDTVWLRLVYHRLAGQLSHSDLSAHVIVLSITGFAFLSLPLGVSIAASIRVGQTLGEGRPDIARVSAQLSVVLGAGFMGASGLAMLLAGDRMGAIFTSNEEVLATVAVIAPVAALFQVVDGIQGCAQGVLRYVLTHHMQTSPDPPSEPWMRLLTANFMAVSAGVWVVRSGT